MTPSYGLLLAPGAGADSAAPGLLAVEEAVVPAVVVRRMDFPYRLAKRRAPDRPAVLLQAVREEMAKFSDVTGIPAERIFAGGRSMGGRMCSIAVAEGMRCAGLVLLSYPLHPPGRPEKLRAEHFPDLAVPCLFVSGTRDAFGSPRELETHSEAIAGRVEHVWIEGGDHGMNKHNPAVAAGVAEWLTRRTNGG